MLLLFFSFFSLLRILNIFNTHMGRGENVLKKFTMVYIQKCLTARSLWCIMSFRKRRRPRERELWVIHDFSFQTERVFQVNICVLVCSYYFELIILMKFTVVCFQKCLKARSLCCIISFRKRIRPRERAMSDTWFFLSSRKSFSSKHLCSCV